MKIPCRIRYLSVFDKKFREKITSRNVITKIVITLFKKIEIVTKKYQLSLIEFKALIYPRWRKKLF